MAPHWLRIVMMIGLVGIGAILVENITTAFHQVVHGADITAIDHPAR